MAPQQRQPPPRAEPPTERQPPQQPPPGQPRPPRRQPPRRQPSPDEVPTKRVRPSAPNRGSGREQAGRQQAPEQGGTPPRGAPVPPRSAVARAAEARRQAARAAAANATARRAEVRARARADFAKANAEQSVARNSGSIAIATLVSKITGFLKMILLAALLGFGTRFDSYSLADTLPNKLTELLLSGVLTAVAVPVLVRARQEDADDGMEYTQRLMTTAVVWMGAATVLATAAAPLLTDLYVDSSTGRASPALVTAFGYLLLPEIFFYAMTALISAILNAKSIFKPTAWAPVLNNVIVLVTGLLYLVEPGEITLNPVRMSDPKLLTLGIGTTLGIVAQVAAMLPALRRSGFRWRWRWGVDARLKEFGELALWVLGYVAATQIGILVIDRVATAAAQGTVSIYNMAWLLVQLPYGVIGFALLTAILPRMSKNAGEGNVTALVDDLSFGNRMSTVMLGPISGLMTILGPQIGLALFSLGQPGADDATRLGLTLTASAFGLLPFSITLVQTRVFYAMKDARTPTLMMLLMVVVRIPLAYLCPVLLPPGQVVYGLAFTNAISFVVGAVAGQYWLRRSLGNLGNGPVLVTIGKTIVASAWGGAATLLVIKLLHALFSGASRVALAWPVLILGTAVGGVVTVGAMMLLRVPELKPAIDRVSRLIRRR